MAQEVNIEEIANRFGRAVVTMDIGRLMTDLTPEAMTKLQAQAGGGMAIQISSFEILSHSRDGDDYLVDSKFLGPTNFTMRARWRHTGGEWKIVDADVISTEPGG
ncbi:MAG: hypothetical protein ACE5IZ_08860 [Dehalococcoidia bacterium]